MANLGTGYQPIFSVAPPQSAWIANGDEWMTYPFDWSPYNPEVFKIIPGMMVEEESIPAEGQLWPRGK